MRLLAAVYGFEITRPISFGSWRIEPVTDVYETARAMARDQEAYNLTATVVGKSLPDDERLRLEGVLCFVEHLDVVIMHAAQRSSPTARNQQRPKCRRYCDCSVATAAAGRSSERIPSTKNRAPISLD